MRRPEFTPHTWYNADKTLKFVMDKYGMTDILPGPNSETMKYLRSVVSEGQKNILQPKPYDGGAPQHIHWAYKPKTEEE